MVNQMEINDFVDAKAIPSWGIVAAIIFHPFIGGSDRDIKSDVAVLQNDVTIIKDDISELKDNIKDNISELKDDIKEILERLPKN